MILTDQSLEFRDWDFPDLDENPVHKAEQFLTEMADEATSHLNEMANHLGLTDFKSMKSEERRRFNKSHLYYIASNKGDDCAIVSNSLLFGPLVTLAGKLIAGIKLSWGDVGQNSRIGHYCEEIYLIPPSAKSHWDNAITYFKNEAMVYALDSVKLKMLSAVRKQTNLETDLPSKYEKLSKLASYVDRSSPTYNFHQLALVLSLGIFDFSTNYKSPYLFQSEGGTGGEPPFGNVDTAIMSLFHHSRGRASETTLGLIKESILINRGNLPPCDSIYLRWTHQAQSGSKAWFKACKDNLSLEEKGTSPGEIRKLLQVEGDAALPDSIRDLGIEIKSKDFSTGLFVSRLRAEGLIMTELDAVLAYQASEKMRAVYGDQNIGEKLVIHQQKLEQFKKKNFSLLAQYGTKHKEIGESLSIRLNDLKDVQLTEARQLFTEYYNMHSNYGGFMSSFVYGDKFLVFKTHEVKALLSSDNRSMFTDSLFSRSEDGPKSTSSRVTHLEENKAKTVIDFVKDMEHKIPLHIVPGLIADDVRIFRIIQSVLETAVEFPSVVLVTDDRDLVLTLNLYLRRHNTINNVTRMGLISYLALIEQNEREVCLDFPIDPGIRLYHPGRRIFVASTKSTITTLKQISGAKLRERSLLIYDGPNLVRGTKYWFRKGAYVYSDKTGIIDKNDARWIWLSGDLTDNVIARRKFGRKKRVELQRSSLSDSGSWRSGSASSI